MKRKNCNWKNAKEENLYLQNEFDDDIVFARFINYMKSALLHKKLDYNKHQDFLKRKESNLNYEEWIVLSNRDSSVHSFSCFNYDYHKLDDAIIKLTDKQRFVIVNYYYKNKSLAEIAKKLKMNSNAVYQLKVRAILSLKRYMED